MKLGLITDIHEHVDHLRTALDRLHSEQVDQIVMIGDVFETGQRIEETCQLLAESHSVGVWGNHDFGFCVALDHELRRRYRPVVIDYMHRCGRAWRSTAASSRTSNRGSIPRI